MAEGVPAFHVSWNRRGIDRLIALTDRAKDLDVLSDWSQAFRSIVSRLRTDPRRSGDPLYQLPRLRLMMYRMIVDRIVVVYAVHEELPSVFIQDIVPCLGHPLES